jgi:hypothetical protein
VPPGFAPGFVVTSDSAECLYKTTDYRAPEHERSILWSDPALAIEWPISGASIVSASDSAAHCWRTPTCSPEHPGDKPAARSATATPTARAAGHRRAKSFAPRGWVFNDAKCWIPPEWRYCAIGYNRSHLH